MKKIFSTFLIAVILVPTVSLANTSNLEEQKLNLLRQLVVLLEKQLKLLQGEKDNSHKELDGRIFKLASFNDQRVNEEYVLEFTKGRISTKFCNGMGGEYTIKNNTIEATLVSTMMYCNEPANVMDMESAFSSALYEGATFTVTKNNLTLTDGKNEFVYTAK